MALILVMTMIRKHWMTLLTEESIEVKTVDEDDYSSGGGSDRGGDNHRAANEAAVRTSYTGKSLICLTASICN